LGAPVALKDIGMREEELDRCAEIASQNAYWNPRPVEREAIRALLDNAYHGRPPSC
jgi:maleylacetate reductase